jgi:hypothetical protein
VLVTLVVPGGIVVWLLALYGTGEMLLAAVAGAVLSTLNVLAGFLTIEYAFEKSYTTFLKAVLGGLGVRMAATLGILLVLILVVKLHPVALTLSALGFYLVYLVLEILFIQRKMLTKGQ